MTTPNILVFAGSVRTGSYNRRLADYMAGRFADAGASVTRMDLKEFPLPIYDGDLEVSRGTPSEALAMHALFRSHHGVFIASPEYNGSLSPLLTNVLAWVSRVLNHGGQAAAFGHPVFALGSASPGPFGGYRGLMALRQTLELGLGARVLPSMVSVGQAVNAFDDAGDLIPDFPKQLADRTLSQLLDAAQRNADVRDVPLAT